jgi:hypothetical protein
VSGAAPSLHAALSGFRPETALEGALLADRRLRAGLAWGSPRLGHPEGSVARHVAAILGCIDDRDPLRADLRLLALVHDAFKGELDPAAGWSPANDHAVLARRFAERFTSDERLLATLELHDEPYWLWRTQADDATFDATLERIPDVALFVRFVELDASTEGKDVSFLWWFRRELGRRGALPEAAVDAPLPASDAGDEVLYVKTFAMAPDDQAALAGAARRLVATHARHLAAEGRVLVSDDGVRVALEWRWRGQTTARLLRDGEVVRRALEADPIFARAHAVDARLFREFTPVRDAS